MAFDVNNDKVPVKLYVKQISQGLFDQIKNQCKDEWCGLRTPSMMKSKLQKKRDSQIYEMFHDIFDQH